MSNLSDILSLTITMLIVKFHLLDRKVNGGKDVAGGGREQGRRRTCT